MQHRGMGQQVLPASLGRLGEVTQRRHGRRPRRAPAAQPLPAPPPCTYTRPPPTPHAFTLHVTTTHNFPPFPASLPAASPSSPLLPPLRQALNTTLLTLGIYLTGLNNTLFNPATPFTGTLFAPTDVAFYSMLDVLGITPNNLTGDPSQMGAFILYHITNNVVATSQVTGPLPVPTRLMWVPRAQGLAGAACLGRGVPSAAQQRQIHVYRGVPGGHPHTHIPTARTSLWA